MQIEGDGVFDAGTEAEKRAAREVEDLGVRLALLQHVEHPTAREAQLASVALRALFMAQSMTEEHVVGAFTVMSRARQHGMVVSTMEWLRQLEDVKRTRAMFGLLVIAFAHMRDADAAMHTVYEAEAEGEPALTRALIRAAALFAEQGATGAVEMLGMVLESRKDFDSFQRESMMAVRVRAALHSGGLDAAVSCAEEQMRLSAAEILQITGSDVAWELVTAYVTRAPLGTVLGFEARRDGAREAALAAEAFLEGGGKLRSLMATNPELAKAAPKLAHDWFGSAPLVPQTVFNEYRVAEFFHRVATRKEAVGVRQTKALTRLFAQLSKERRNEERGRRLARILHASFGFAFLHHKLARPLSHQLWKLAVRTRDLNLQANLIAQAPPSRFTAAVLGELLLEDVQDAHPRDRFTHVLEGLKSLGLAREVAVEDLIVRGMVACAAPRREGPDVAGSEDGNSGGDVLGSDAAPSALPTWNETSRLVDDALEVMLLASNVMERPLSFTSVAMVADYLIRVDDVMALQGWVGTLGHRTGPPSTSKIYALLNTATEYYRSQRLTGGGRVPEVLAMTLMLVEPHLMNLPVKDSSMWGRMLTLALCTPCPHMGKRIVDTMVQRYSLLSWEVPARFAALLHRSILAGSLGHGFVRTSPEERSNRRADLAKAMRRREAEAATRHDSRQGAPVLPSEAVVDTGALADEVVAYFEEADVELVPYGVSGWYVRQGLAAYIRSRLRAAEAASRAASKRIQGEEADAGGGGLDSPDVQEEDGLLAGEAGATNDGFTRRPAPLDPDQLFDDEVDGNAAVAAALRGDEFDVDDVIRNAHAAPEVDHR